MQLFGIFTIVKNVICGKTLYFNNPYLQSKCANPYTNSYKFFDKPANDEMHFLKTLTCVKHAIWGKSL